MNAVGRLGSYIYRGVGTVSGPFHPFGGAVDIIVVEHPDGTFKSSPWYVRFGKFQGVLKNRRNVIKIDVNDADAGFNMYLDHTGQAYFLREMDDVVEEGDTVMYPLSSGDEADANGADVRRTMKAKSCSYDVGSDRANNGNIVGKPGIFGFVFGKRSLKDEKRGGSGVERASSLERAEIAADLLDVKWSTNLNSEVTVKEQSNIQMNDEEREANAPSLVIVSEMSFDEAESSSSCDDGLVRDRLEGKCVVPLKNVVEFHETPIFIQNDDHSTAKASILGASSLEASPILHFVDGKGQDYNENISVVQCGESSDQNSVSSNVASAVLCEASGGLVLPDEGSYEATSSQLLVPSNDNGEIDVYAESKNTKTSAPPITQDVLAKYSAEFEQELLDVPESVLSNDATLDEAHEADLGNFGVHARSRSDLQITDNIVVEDVHHSAGNHEGPQSTSFASEMQSESLEEEQFVFSDLDEPKPGRSDCAISVFSNTMKVDGKEVYRENDTFGENPIEKSKVVSNPINICRKDECTGEGVRLAESLPNMWFQTPDPSANYCQPLSQSLDPNPKSLKWGFRKDDSSSENSEADKWNKDQLETKEKNAEDSLDSKAFKHVIANPQFVELSLCKPLFSEGMGAEAASQVFDSKKLDMNKLASLGPSIVKNEKLVVRIGGCYFPWGTAAPIILGMVSFGADKIFEPKGMIVVDQIVKSGDVAQGGGSWMLWPFSRKRSRKNRENLVSSRHVTEIEEQQHECKPDKDKKMVKVLTPTSEQLASLNLKDGRNSVVFTFSTNMLGTQQSTGRRPDLLVEIKCSYSHLRCRWNNHKVGCSRPVYAYGWHRLVTNRCCTFIFRYQGKWVSFDIFECTSDFSSLSHQTIFGEP